MTVNEIFTSPDWSSHSLGILVNYTGNITTSSFGYNATGTTSVSGTKNNFYFCAPGFTGVTATGVSMSVLVSNSDTYHS